MKKLIFILILSFYFFSIKAQECYTWFTYEYNELSDTTHFTSYAITEPNDQVVQYIWSFDDGTTSNAQNPNHLFTNGTGYVCLTMVTNSGCNWVNCRYVLIQEPTCNISSTFSVTNPINGQNNGSIVANITQGKPPYTLVWSNNSIGDSIGNLSAGTYSLTIVDNQSCQKVDTVELYNTETVSLSGDVYAGNTFLPEGRAILFEKQGTQINAKKITNIQNGHYDFEYVTPGVYNIYAIPYFNYNVNYFPIYFPTYVGNTINWQNAMPLNILAKTIIPPVQLSLNESINYGNASISGVITYTNIEAYETNIYNSNWFNISPISGTNTPYPARNITILLFDENGVPLKYALSDEFGHFQFNNLKYGTYLIYADKAGKLSSPTSIELTDTNSNNNNTLMILDNTSIYYSIENIDKNSIRFKSYPNPFNNQVTISINNEFKSDVDLLIISTLGQTVYEERFSLPSGDITHAIDTQNIKAGIYTIKLIINNTRVLTNKIVKL